MFVADDPSETALRRRRVFLVADFAVVNCDTGSLAGLGLIPRVFSSINVSFITKCTA